MRMVGEIYEAYRDDVYRYLLGQTRDPSLAEDLTSDTFLAAIRGLQRFQGEGDIKTWLFSIARHKWYDYLRRRKKLTSMEELAGVYLEEDMEAAALRRDQLQAILRFLEKEDLRCREIVLLRMEGYAFREIAQRLGISENTARVADFRTKKKLKEMLRKEGLWDDETAL